MVVIAMTSWKKRIDNVKNIIDSILKNTILPDRIYLTLSSDEFPQKEKELPTDLVELFNSNETLILNWVKENTKCFKKIFPVLDFLNDDDIIISADDDILFPKDLIESRLKDFNNHNKKYCISSNTSRTVGFHHMNTISAISLFQKKMFKGWNIYLNDNIINTYNDDRTYLYLLMINGFKNIGCTKWDIKTLLKQYDMNQGNAITGSCGVFGKKYDVIAKQRLNELNIII